MFPGSALQPCPGGGQALLRRMSRRGRGGKVGEWVTEKESLFPCLLAPNLLSHCANGDWGEKSRSGPGKAAGWLAPVHFPLGNENAETDAAAGCRQ